MSDNQKPCTNKSCEHTMHRCMTGSVMTTEPPKYPTAWVCLHCKTTEIGEAITYPKYNSTKQNNAIERLRDISPMYQFMATPEYDGD